MREMRTKVASHRDSSESKQWEEQGDEGQQGPQPSETPIKKIIDISGKCQLCVSEGGRISELMSDFCRNIKKCGLTDELHRVRGHWKQTITTRYSQRDQVCFYMWPHPPTPLIGPLCVSGFNETWLTTAARVCLSEGFCMSFWVLVLV